MVVMRSVQLFEASYGKRPCSGWSSRYGRMVESPYALSEDATSTWGTAHWRAASRSIQVPRTLASSVLTGSFFATPTSVWAPRWNTVSISYSASERRTSPSSVSAPYTVAMRSSQPSRTRRLRGEPSRTRATTVAPRWTSSGTTQLPRSPVAPVTKTRRPFQKVEMSVSQRDEDGLRLDRLFLDPRGGPPDAQALQLHLVLTGIHRLPEAQVLVHVQQAAPRELRQHFLLEVVAVPLLERALLENEEAGVDPVVAHQRLLLELPHAADFIEDHQAVLGAQRHRGERRETPGAFVRAQQRVQVEVAEAVAIGGEEPLAHEFGTALDAVARIGVRAGVDDAHLPVVEALREVVVQHLDAMPAREHEILVTLRRIGAHEVHQDRRAVDRHHHLGKVLGERVRPRALATAENYDFHVFFHLRLPLFSRYLNVCWISR